MCGVAVLCLSRDVSSVDRSAFHAALASLEPRGPDESRGLEVERCLIGSARLRLWNEGAATQPWSRDRVIAVFNGELFNLDELRQRLGSPHASELEVLVLGVTAHGVEFLNDIDGQFAGVIVDQSRDRALFFRDRWGQVPLYLGCEAGVTAGASTAAAVRMMLGHRRGVVDSAGIVETACWWAPVAPTSSWQGVEQVPPGSFVYVERGSVTARGRWVPAPLPTSERALETTVDTADLSNRLNASVRLRSRTSGTPLTVALSGGVDSFLVATSAASLGLKHTFGLVSREGSLEHAHQQLIGNRLGLSHEAVVLHPRRVLESFEGALRKIGTPLVRLAPIGMSILADEVSRAGFRVCLTGEGADEMFAGYDSFRILAASRGEYEGKSWAEFGTGEFDAANRAGPLYWRFAADNRAGPLDSRINAGRFLTRFLRFDPSGLLAKQESRAVNSSSDVIAALESHRRAEIDTLLSSYLLTVQSDHAWAASAVECRFPWLGSHVTDLALRVSAKSMIEASSGKLPIRALGAEKAEELGLDPAMFSKRAFRVDLSHLMADPRVFDGFMEYCRACPDELLDVEGVLGVMDACRERARWPEPQSMLVTLAATFGVLCN